MTDNGSAYGFGAADRLREVEHGGQVDQTVVIKKVDEHFFDRLGVRRRWRPGASLLSHWSRLEPTLRVRDECRPGGANSACVASTGSSRLRWESVAGRSALERRARLP